MISDLVLLRCKSIRGALLPSLLSLIFLFAPGVASGEVSMPAIFSDHMVLAWDADVPVWGKAASGEKVTVQIATITSKTTAASDGRWIVRLDLRDLGHGPYEMHVDGENKIVISDVVIGAVWLASGQSNMEHKLKATLGAEQEIESSANPQLREFRVEKVMKAEPADDCSGHWVIAGPATSGAFSAVAYYFGKRLQDALQIPVGIIDASWSGTYSELWISHESIESVDSLRSGEAARQKLISEFSAKQAAWVSNFETWLEVNKREDRPAGDSAIYTEELSDTKAWTPIQLPGVLSETPGIFWIRKDIDVPAEAASPNQEFKVMLGRLNGFEQVYWNGVKVSETPYWKFPGQGYARYFPIPPNLVRPGKNTLALRVYAPGTPLEISVDATAFKAGPVRLAGEWLERAEFEFPQLSADALTAMPRSPAQVSKISASSIFNGVIHPLIPYAIAGIIWYQGESDTARAAEYGSVFPLLIRDWRKQWNRGAIPFYFCQLPGVGPKLAQPQESEWAELRESQSKALELPNTAEAVLIDLGESDEIHYRQKKPVGERLARIALSQVYGRNQVISGPIFESMRIHDSKIEILFTHAAGGLSAHELPASYEVSTLLGKTAPLIPNSPASELQGFAICGADHRWVWVDAKIVNADTVMVRSDLVPHPVAVRYSWADDPTVNLFNGAGLPAAPFRTDSFPALTASNHYGGGT